ncbi:MAG: autotransporter-associated beta strand repeat-containing protein [Akkermansiaceae bacterium]|jgi:autotransporter-associated beta strand protein|nr:autotransporter-associated beta strand repeat-containing protein [Akkermansiaceae bacterium]
MRKTLLQTALLVGSIGAVGAQTTAWTGATNQDWATATNWNNGVPGINSRATINLGTGNTPIITTAVNKSATAGGNDLWIGWGAGTTGRLDINSGGSLNTNGTWIFLGGNGGGVGTLNVNSGGSLTSDNHIRVGRTGGGTGTINVDGGTIAVGAIVAEADSRINVSNGGTITSAGDIGMRNGNSSISGTGSAITSTAGQIFVGQGTGSVTMDMSGGSMASGTWFVVGINTGVTTTFNMSGGAVSSANANASNAFSTIGAAGATGTINMTGGTWTDKNLTFLGENAGGTGTFNLDGGTLHTARVVRGAGTAFLNFDGGTLRAYRNEPDFISATLPVDIEDGGATIDSNGFTVTSNAAFSGVGSLTKSGAGTVNLNSDDHTFSGAVTVSAGTLNLGARFTTPEVASVTISDGAAFGITTTVPDDNLAPTDLTFGGASTTLNVNLGDQDFLIPDAPLVVNGGSLNLSGTITVNLTGDDLASGNYTLINYSTGSKTGSATWSVGSLPPGATGTISDTGTAIVLNLTVPAPVWSGSVDSSWDTTTINWIDSGTLTPTAFSPGDPVTFDDTATNFAVNVATNVAPTAIEFENAANNYTLGTSGGVITGATGITKSGAGKLTLSPALANTFTGVIAINGGTISTEGLSNGGVASPLGAATAVPGNIQFNGGTLEVTGASASTSDRGFTILANANAISNTGNLTLSGQVANGNLGGSFTKTGAGTLTYSHLGTSSFGNGFPSLAVNQGTWVFDGTGGTQAVTLPGEVWVGATPNVPANLSLINTNVTINSWLAVSRGNGDTGSVVNIDVTDSILTTGQMSSGFNNGLPNQVNTNITLSNSTWTNTGTLVQLSESQNSTTNLTLNTGSVLNANRLLLGLGENAVVNMDMNGSADVNLGGGQWFAIGAGYGGGNGSATLTMNDNSTFTDTEGDFNIADVGTVTGALVINDNALFEHVGVTGANACYIGKGIGSIGTLTINDSGTFTTVAPVRVGWSTSSQGTVNLVGGSFNQTDAADPVVVGFDGQGTLNIGATFNANGTGILLGQNATGSGSVSVTTGGLLIVRDITTGAGAGSLVINGGTLRALENNANFVNVPSVAIQASGATVDTNGFDVTIPSALSGVGGLTKSGVGTLVLDGASIYEGNTTLNQGVLSLTNPVLDDDSSVVIATGAGINLPHGQVDYINGLTINGTALPDGDYTAISHPGFITGTGTLRVGDPPAGGYTAWIAGFFPGETNPLIVGPDADPDGDGQANSLEFMLGGSPASGSDNARVYQLAADSDTDTIPELILTIAVPTGTPAFVGTPAPSATQDGYVIMVEGSTDLSAFTQTVNPVNPVTTDLPAAPAGYEYRSFSLGGSNGFPSRGFMRVDVTAAP